MLFTSYLSRQAGVCACTGERERERMLHARLAGSHICALSGGHGRECRAVYVSSPC